MLQLVRAARPRQGLQRHPVLLEAVLSCMILYNPTLFLLVFLKISTNGCVGLILGLIRVLQLHVQHARDRILLS